MIRIVPTRQKTLIRLSFLLADRNQPEAEQYLREAITVRQEALSATHPDVANILERLGRYLTAQKRYSEALAAHQQALDIRSQSTGTPNAAIARSMFLIASLKYHFGQYQETETILRQALDIRHRNLSSQSSFYRASRKPARIVSILSGPAR